MSLYEAAVSFKENGILRPSHSVREGIRLH
ncbi:hypothetical protein DFP90_1315 [Aestuariispira insulae]|uniref:Uncharacterized protein n=1 Tax=Aestuariispira insulae TaxID=1461337 RepID=A0A3D9H1F7_9PROT|nr:hypothetical protein DFP90_1315 [Aestuariispira insulae]